MSAGSANPSILQETVKSPRSYPDRPPSFLPQTFYVAIQPNRTMADDKTAANAAPAAKKEKPPKPEDKPFQEFITEFFIPSLQKTLTNQGLSDISLSFVQAPFPVKGLEGSSDCWQVVGQWQGGQRQFCIGFAKEDISGPKFYCAADSGARPSTLESFMIDERKATLDLMVFYTVQRLNGQKWLARN